VDELSRRRHTPEHARWVCQFCEREFGRPHQSHVCVPGNTVDETFAGHPPQWRAAFDAVLDHLRTLGPVHVDAVKVGVFLKSDRKLAEVRPRVRAVDLLVKLSRGLDDARVAGRRPGSTTHTWHVVKLREASDVDDQVRAWLTEAYGDATD
jgi:hypothetical protein